MESGGPTIATFFEYSSRTVLRLPTSPDRLAQRCLWATPMAGLSSARQEISALVNIAARAPEAGEDFAALTKSFPATAASTGTVHDDGFARLTEDAFIHDFVVDLSIAKARALHAVQQPAADSLYNFKTTKAAWHSKPS